MPIDLATNAAALLVKICPAYGINSSDILHEFLANVLHESAGFTISSENLNYQAPALVINFIKNRPKGSIERITVDDCYKYGRTLKQKANQPEIAKRIYGGQWGLINLGNRIPGKNATEEEKKAINSDGWNFRGAGAIQITGYGNGKLFADYYNKMMKTNHSVMEIYQLIRTNLEVSIHAACWLFAVAKKLIDEALHNDMRGIVKKINGGFIGLDKRMAILALCIKYIP